MKNSIEGGSSIPAAVQEIGRRVRKLPRKNGVPDGLDVLRVIARVQGGEPHVDFSRFNQGVVPQDNKA